MLFSWPGPFNNFLNLVTKMNQNNENNIVVVFYAQPKSYCFTQNYAVYISKGFNNHIDVVERSSSFLFTVGELL